MHFFENFLLRFSNRRQFVAIFGRLWYEVDAHGYDHSKELDAGFRNMSLGICVVVYVLRLRWWKVT